MNKLVTTILLFIIVGCSTPVGKDYVQYLNNNQGRALFAKVNIGKYYFLDEKAKEHKKAISSFAAGIGNKWFIEFESVIDATLASHDYVNAFGHLEKINALPASERFLKISLIEYDFRNHRAYMTVLLEVLQEDKSILRKQYYAEGEAQGGKMFWGGALAMKNAIQQSTMLSLNKIFMEFSHDVKNIK